jgi:Domain of unknown function (DUF4783)
MKKIITSIFITAVLLSKLVFADSEQDINNAIRIGSYKTIASFFKETVELNLPGNEGLYSKAQAELILKDFFVKNTAKSFTAKHGGESKDGAKFNIGTLVTSNGNFRTYFFLKKEGDLLIIKELRIEKE